MGHVDRAEGMWKNDVTLIAWDEGLGHDMVHKNTKG